MASPAAKAFFDKQSPQDRMAIIDSWGGQDLTDEWFANAQAAGSVTPAQPTAQPGGPPPSNVVLGNSQTVDQLFASQRAGDSTGADAFRDPVYSTDQWGAWEQQERDTVSGGKSANQTVNKYNPDGKGCPGDKPFTSRPGPGGQTECASKPDDCPDGSGLHGSKCVGNDWLNANLGGDRPSEQEMGASFAPSMGGGEAGGRGAGGAGAGAAAQQGAGPAYFGQDDPLQRMLTNQMASGGGSFAGTASGGQFAGGGVFSQGAGQYGQPATTGTGTANPAATAALGALAPAAPAPAAPAPAPVAAPVAAPFAAPEPATYSDPYEAWKQGGRTGPAPGRSAPASPGGPPAPAEPRADPFEMVPGSGSFEDLIDPRRRKQDARLGGNWF